MKKGSVALLLLFVVILASAQQNIGIGTLTPHSSAVLDASSTTKGMLVPRMNKVQKNGIPLPAKGLLVFQDDTDSVGFHYYNGTRWIWLIGNDIADTVSWKRNGNTGTNPGVHFIGTTDFTPFLFKTGNLLSGRIDPIYENVSFGRGAGVRLSPASGSNLQGKHNTYIGHEAGFADSIGFFNVFVGNNSGNVNKSGTNNTFLGYSSGVTNTNGDFNVLLGARTAKSLTTGGSNTVIGAEAGDIIKDGGRNVLIGYDADMGDSSLINATAIGTFARVDTSNAMVLGSINGINHATVSVNVGIGTTKPKSRLHVLRGVNGGSYLSNSLAILEDNANSYIQLMHSNAAETGLVSGNTSTSIRSAVVFRADSSLQLQTGGNIPRLTVDKTGKTGIGIVTPRALLHLHRQNADEHIALSGVFAADTAFIKYENRILQFRNTHSTGGFWEFQDRFGNQQCLISSNGNVHMNGGLTVMEFSGINTVSPLAGLHIKGFLPSSYDSHIRLESAGPSTDYAAMVYDGDMKFRTFGAGDQYQWRNAAGTINMRLTETGDLTTVGTVNGVSDARLKQNIHLLDNSLQKIIRLNGYTYNWKNVQWDTKLQTGLLAQELEKVIPELVRTDEEGMKSVNYSGLIPYLIESIKELKREIETIKKMIADN